VFKRFDPERKASTGNATWIALGLLLTPIAVMLVVIVAGARRGEPPAATVQSSGATQQPIASAANPAQLQLEPEPPAISKIDRANVCLAAIGALTGRDPKTVRVMFVRDGVLYTSYRRPDDGSTWMNACRVGGERVQWASVNVGNGDDFRVGRWRNSAEDEVVTFKVGPPIQIRISYSDGTFEDHSYKMR
jgi:hypothetical protein